MTREVIHVMIPDQLCLPISEHGDAIASIHVM